MFDAQLLMGSTAVYSPWFPRQGDSMTVTCELVAVSGESVNLTVTVYTKKADASGNGTLVSGAGSIVVNDGQLVDYDQYEGNLEDLVRYKFTTASGVTNWWLFRMRDPIWYNAINAS